MSTEDTRKGLENLEVWKRASAFAVAICQEIIPTLPSEEKYALASQLRRAVQSIPANIAEGYGRYYYQEGIRYSYIARGSIEETYSHLYLASRLSYISPQLFQKYALEIMEMRMMLNGFIAYLKRSKRGEKEPGNNYQIRDHEEYPASEFENSDISFEENP